MKILNKEALIRNIISDFYKIFIHQQDKHTPGMRRKTLNKLRNINPNIRMFRLSDMSKFVIIYEDNTKTEHNFIH